MTETQILNQQPIPVIRDWGFLFLDSSYNSSSYCPSRPTSEDRRDTLESIKQLFEGKTHKLTLRRSLRIFGAFYGSDKKADGERSRTINIETLERGASDKEFIAKCKLRGGEYEEFAINVDEMGKDARKQLADNPNLSPIRGTYRTEYRGEDKGQYF